MSGEQIKATRLGKGWSRKMLAYASGVSEDTIYFAETEKRNVSQESLKEIKYALESQ